MMQERIVTESRNVSDPGLPKNALIFRALNPLTTGPLVGIEDVLRAGLSCIATSVGLVSTFIIGLEVGGVLTGHPPGTITGRIIEDVRTIFRGDSKNRYTKKKRK